MIHPVKIGGEDSGFVAACPGADFHDRIAFFRLIRRQQRDLKVAFKIGDAFFELRNFIVSHGRDLDITRHRKLEIIV